MSFIPRIQVTIANNRCSCCEEDSVKPQPKDMAVFFKDGKFIAKRDKNDFSVIYSQLINATRQAIHEFLLNNYKIKSDELPDGYKIILSKRLPSLEEVHDIEKMASEILSRKSESSLDRSLSPSPNKKELKKTP